MEGRLHSCEEPIFQCSICCTDVVDRREIFQIEACHCQFCKECVRRYCIRQLHIATIPIRCPELECNRFLTSNEIHSLLSDTQFNLYNKLILDYEVTNDPHRLFCSHVDCNHILRLPNEHKIHQEQQMTCTECQTTFCLQCRCQWHPNERCSDFLTSCATDIHSSIKRCPRCRLPLERTAGCAQITCVNCKHIFCWYCLQSLDTDFFLLHFERGPCRYRLGHSRSSLFLHRLMMIGLLMIFVFLLIITAPLLVLIVPCLFCCRYKQIKTYVNKLIKWEQQPSTAMDQSRNEFLVDLEQPTRISLV